MLIALFFVDNVNLIAEKKSLFLNIPLSTDRLQLQYRSAKTIASGYNILPNICYLIHRNSSSHLKPAVQTTVVVELSVALFKRRRA